MGTLTIRGKVDLNQIWPNGNSDADTLKVSIAGIKNPFRFKPAGAPSLVTHVFDTATVSSAFGKLPVIENDKFDVRLQGIDAPELHYKPQRFRQRYAESGAVALGAMLASTGKTMLSCRVVTHVEAPNDVCDMFGRVVGEIIVRLGNKSVNVNEWIAREGWGFPAFYTSMTAAEIAQFAKLTEDARAAKKGVWRAGAYTPQIGPLDQTLRERKIGSAPVAEGGTVSWPKYYRRLVEWQIATGAKPATLKAHLAGKAQERFVTTTDFLAHGLAASLQQPLASALDANDRMTLPPREFVIVEKPSTLYAADGKTKVTAWA